MPTVEWWNDSRTSTVQEETFTLPEKIRTTRSITVESHCGMCNCWIASDRYQLHLQMYHHFTKEESAWVES